MKSSVYVVQTINEALKERVDELAVLRESDGQVLQLLMAYVQSLPRLHTVRDERTHEQMFQVDLDPTRNIQASSRRWLCVVEEGLTGVRCVLRIKRHQLKQRGKLPEGEESSG